MSRTPGRNHSPAFRVRVALQALECQTEWRTTPGGDAIHAVRSWLQHPVVDASRGSPVVGGDLFALNLGRACTSVGIVQRFPLAAFAND
ncbi:MAG: hypothetical protein M0Q87_10440 [Ottowia sp.]|nr:hypothetical protein [Ottowia sp.]